MAEVTIDTSTIKGYAEMSAEDKIKALEGFKFNDVSSDLKAAQEQMEKLKAATDNATHEAAEYKKKLKDAEDKANQGMSDSEKAVAELRQQVADLTKANQLASLKATRVSLGYSNEMAAEYAQAQMDNDFSKIAEIEKKFLDEHDKNYKAELLKNTPKPGQGGKSSAPKGMTLEKLKAMPLEDRMKFHDEHPEEYTKLYTGEIKEV